MNRYHNVRFSNMAKPNTEPVMRGISKALGRKGGMFKVRTKSFNKLSCY